MRNAWQASPVALKMFDTFSDLDDKELAQLSESSELRHYAEGDALISQGQSPEWIFYILSGVAKLSRKIRASDQDGDSQTEVIVQMFGVNDAIGDTSIYLDYQFKGTIKAVTNCDVLAVSRKAMCELALRNQSVLLNLFNRTSIKFLRAVEGFDLSYGKLLERIEVLSDECNKVGIDLYKHFSKSDIARMLGVSRVAVSQTMNAS